MSRKSWNTGYNRGKEEGEKDRNRLEKENEELRKQNDELRKANDKQRNRGRIEGGIGGLLIGGLLGKMSDDSEE